METVTGVEAIMELATRLHEASADGAIRYLLKHTDGDARSFRLAARRMIELHGAGYTAAWRMGAVLVGAARVVEGQRTASRSSKPQGA